MLPCLSTGVQLQKTLVVVIAVVACAALVSCSESRPLETSSAAMGYDSSTPIARAPLPPTAGYAASPTTAPHEDPLPEDIKPAGKWSASPRWSSVQGDGCIVVDQDRSGQAGSGNGKLTYENCSAGKAANDELPESGY